MFAKFQLTHLIQQNKQKMNYSQHVYKVLLGQDQSIPNKHYYPFNLNKHKSSEKSNDKGISNNNYNRSVVQKEWETLKKEIIFEMKSMSLIPTIVSHTHKHQEFRHKDVYTKVIKGYSWF